MRIKPARHAHACAFCDGTLGVNTVLRSSHVGSHVVISESHGRAWFVCERCDRWNLADPETGVEVLRECSRYFGNSPERLVAGAIGRVSIGTLLITNVDSSEPIDFLVARHAARAARRMRERAWVAALANAGTILCIVAGVTTIGGSAGAAVGVAASMLGLFALNRVQRRRRVTIKLPGGAIVAMTRADVSRLAIRIDGQSWALHLPSGHSARVFRGEAAYAILARTIPLFRRSASKGIVQRAVQLLRSWPDETAFVRWVASRREEQKEGRAQSFFVDSKSIWAMSDEELMALNILATERHERRVQDEEFAELGPRFAEALLIAETIDREL